MDGAGGGGEGVNPLQIGAPFTGFPTWLTRAGTSNCVNPLQIGAPFTGGAHTT